MRFSSTLNVDALIVVCVPKAHMVHRSTYGMGAYATDGTRER